MRDIVIAAMVFGSIPFIIWRPWIGSMMWIWISVMNPHRFAWGFAFDMSFAQYIALATLLGILVSGERGKFPWCSVSSALIVLCIWMTVTTFFAIHPDAAWLQWEKVMKIQLMNFVILYLVTTRERLKIMIWVTTLSIALLGAKGGLFTLLSGGAVRVWGPKGSFIEENNQLALATIMAIPMVYYLATVVKEKWQRRGLFGLMVLCAFSVFGSHSRGAFLAIAAMSLFMIMKSRQRFMMLGLVGLLAPILWMFMPDHWTERMESINDYQEDGSAMGRINAWTMAYNLALDRPIVGGGFETWTFYAFGIWAPNPLAVHSSHSNYFQFLGEHGWPGLFLFLTVLGLAWKMASAVIRLSQNRPEVAWYGDLCRMIQVSLIGYSVGGAFVNLGYFDLPYFLIGMIILAYVRIREDLTVLERDGNLTGAKAVSVGSGRMISGKPGRPATG